MDQAKFLNIIRRYAWLLVLAALVASLTTLFVLNDQPTVFEAKTRILVGPTVDSPSPDLNALRIGGQLMTTYADLATTRPFLESINNKLGQKMNLEELSGMLETKQNTEARILTILVRNEDPKQAVAIANAAADSLLEMSPSQDNTTSLLRTQMSTQAHQLEQIITNAEASIQQLETELIALRSTGPQSPEASQANLQRQDLVTKQLAEERARLSDSLRTLTTIYQVLLQTNTNQLEIIEPAGAVFPINQNLPLRVAAAGLAGLLLVMSIIFAYEYFDDTIRLPGDFTRTVQAPLLSTIEANSRRDRSGLDRVVTLSTPDSEAANSYRTAVARLLFTIGNSTPYTLLLSSVGSADGDEAAITAANLGAAFAQAGNRVVLVDAQVHNPILTQLFEVGGKAGLSDLMFSRSTEPRLTPVKDLQEMQLLSAGLSSEKPGAMLNPGHLARLLEELKKDADVVIVAGPPIAGFAEGLTLASQVNGVVLVARYGEAHSKVINDVAESLKAMDIHLAGVIFEQNAPRKITRRSPRSVATLAPQIEPQPASTAEKTNLP
jgi:capsular polysaccharide biosynthesis protein/Mrp family chromosome partitioning ATPase